MKYNLNKIHFHTDNKIFGGSEKMLSYILNCKKIYNLYDVSFSYISYSKLHKNELNAKVDSTIKKFPIKIINHIDYNNIPSWLPHLLKSIISRFINFLFFIPIVIYQIIYFYFFLKKINPKILHINNGGYPGGLSCRTIAIAGKIAKVQNIIMVVNNLALNYVNFWRWLEYPIDRLVVNSVSYFITGSKAARKELEKVLKISNSFTKNYPNAHFLSKKKSIWKKAVINFKKPSKNHFYIGVLAALQPNKGHKILIEAIEKICIKKKNYSNKKIKIFFAGEGSYKDDLVKLLKKKKISENFIFLGYINNIENFLNSMDIIVQPSLFDEDFPCAVIEAMACKKLVIGSKVAGISEQINDGKTGFLVNPGNVRQLTKAIIKCLNNYKIIKKMGTAAYKRFQQHFSKTKCVSNYINLYTVLVKKN